eukprot:TRINITY_DN66721_c5_g3_i1.p1 TRINITY_DN66721_c5_g3~~TRINITY_DN66721_c5_g3_i1.p1  ORF type:complete len:231 (+),score=11.81 TRINITY_DN66721_c5_g3_i1:41-733(+)
MTHETFHMMRQPRNFGGLNDKPHVTVPSGRRYSPNFILAESDGKIKYCQFQSGLVTNRHWYYVPVRSPMDNKLHDVLFVHASGAGAAYLSSKTRTTLQLPTCINTKVRLETTYPDQKREFDKIFEQSEVSADFLDDNVLDGYCLGNLGVRLGEPEPSLYNGAAITKFQPGFGPNGETDGVVKPNPVPVVVVPQQQQGSYTGAGYSAYAQPYVAPTFHWGSGTSTYPFARV